MVEKKKLYQAPALTEVKFEDQNLVTFSSCSKQANVRENVTGSCCELLPWREPAAIFDPS
jgi:hypothetical protein